MGNLKIGTKIESRNLYEVTQKTVVGFATCKITGDWINIKDDKTGHEESIKSVRQNDEEGSGYFFTKKGYKR